MHFCALQTHRFSYLQVFVVLIFNTLVVTSYLVNPSLPFPFSKSLITRSLSGLKIDQSEGIAAPAIPEEGR